MSSTLFLFSGSVFDSYLSVHFERNGHEHGTCDSTVAVLPSLHMLKVLPVECSMDGQGSELEQLRARA